MRSVLFVFTLLCGSFLSASEPTSGKTLALQSLNLLGEAREKVAVPVPAPAAPARAELSGEALFQALHAAVPKRDISYSEAKAYMYSRADNVICNGAQGIVTFYSLICVNGSSANGKDYPERSDLNGDGVVDSFINAEHIWPQSYFKSSLPMVSDLIQPWTYLLYSQFTPGQCPLHHGFKAGLRHFLRLEARKRGL